MKRFPCLVMAGLLAGCASGEPDALPDDPMRVMKTSAVVPVPTEAMAGREGVPLASIERGHTVFLTKCLECHEPRIPVNPSNPSWDQTIHGMAWNAGLQPADEQALMAYMLAAAGD